MKKQAIRLIIKTLSIAAILFVLFFVVFKFVRVSDNAMQPNLKDGDLALIFKLDKNYTVGDVVSYKKDDKQYFGRIIAANSGIVTINDRHKFEVDSIAEEELNPYIGKAEPLEDGASIPFVVTPDTYYIAFDNRSETNDSRKFGAISKSDIEGKIIYLFRPRGF